jgi:uncharacterized protein YigA (DUF484 family)
MQAEFEQLAAVVQDQQVQIDEVRVKADRPPVINQALSDKQLAQLNEMGEKVDREVTKLRALVSDLKESYLPERM